MFSYFKNRKTTYFDVFCLNFSIETKIKTLFLISYFNLSKKNRLGTRFTLAIFHSVGRLPDSIQEEKIKCNGYKN